MPTRAPIVVLALVLTSLVAACGGSEPPASTTSERPRPQQREPANPLALPASVPRAASGPADPAATRVIRAWSSAMRRSAIEPASALWALPSKIQNGTPVLTLSTRGDVRAFNSSLSCGSVLTAASGARDGFTIATFRLTNRPRGACSTGAGLKARTAIRVRNGKIAEWYRLPDDPDAPDAPSSEPQGPII